ncbi:MAG: hypothetical protein IPL70_04490 [Uliginosibacterium sp.]|nr:hypothetical protein [Uliginosibacterium sp.]
MSPLPGNHHAAEPPHTLAAFALLALLGAGHCRAADGSEPAVRAREPASPLQNWKPSSVRF